MDNLLELRVLCQVTSHLFGIFLYLADRAMHLYPEEDRFICKVETEPAPYGDLAVRVASAI